MVRDDWSSNVDERKLVVGKVEGLTSCVPSEFTDNDECTVFGISELFVESLSPPSSCNQSLHRNFK